MEEKNQSLVDGRVGSPLKTESKKGRKGLGFGGL
jgi:hypothetical protein